MESSAKIMKATGVVHVVHGSIMVLVSILLMILTILTTSIMGGILVLVLTGAISFLYIYIGYELFALRNADKMRNLLVASIILACVEVLAAMAKGQMAGVLFVIELVMSIVAICNIDSYRKFKTKIDREAKDTDKNKVENNTSSSIEYEYFDDTI